MYRHRSAGVRQPRRPYGSRRVLAPIPNEELRRGRYTWTNAQKTSGPRQVDARSGQPLRWRLCWLLLSAKGVSDDVPGAQGFIEVAAAACAAFERAGEERDAQALKRLRRCTRGPATQEQAAPLRLLNGLRGKQEMLLGWHDADGIAEECSTKLRQTEYKKSRIVKSLSESGIIAITERTSALVRKRARTCIIPVVTQRERRAPATTRSFA